MTKRKNNSVLAWAIKHIPTNEIILPICPTRREAVHYSYDNFVNSSRYFKIIRVEIREIKK